LSIEVGFGMGSSAAVILSMRSLAASPFEHTGYDPWGLPDERGQVVQAYLESYFGLQFRLRRKLSHVGLAQLFDERDPGTVGLAFIDSGHRCEDVMADFMLADVPCCKGGFIVFDDAWFPAIETVLSYVEQIVPTIRSRILSLVILRCSSGSGTINAIGRSLSHFRCRSAQIGRRFQSSSAGEAIMAYL
jgi:hypothetical protein